jgi:hypothetical protein
MRKRERKQKAEKAGNRTENYKSTGIRSEFEATTVRYVWAGEVRRLPVSTIQLDQEERVYIIATMTSMKMAVFWDVAPGSLVDTD